MVHKMIGRLKDALRSKIGSKDKHGPRMERSELASFESRQAGQRTAAAIKRNREKADNLPKGWICCRLTPPAAAQTQRTNTPPSTTLTHSQHHPATIQHFNHTRAAPTCTSTACTHRKCSNCILIRYTAAATTSGRFTEQDYYAFIPHVGGTADHGWAHNADGCLRYHDDADSVKYCRSCLRGVASGEEVVYTRTVGV